MRRKLPTADHNAIRKQDTTGGTHARAAPIAPFHLPSPHPGRGYGVRRSWRVTVVLEFLGAPQELFEVHSQGHMVLSAKWFDRRGNARGRCDGCELRAVVVFDLQHAFERFSTIL